MNNNTFQSLGWKAPLLRISEKHDLSQLLVSIGLLGFIFLNLLQPWNAVPKAFVFALIIPCVTWALVKKKIDFSSAHYVWSAFFFLMLYLFISSLLLSDNETNQVTRRLRWTIEVALFSIAVFYVTPLWMNDSKKYPQFFLIMLLIVCIFAITGFHFIGLKTIAAFNPEFVKMEYGSRLTWLGFLTHPIKGPSVVVMLYSIATVLFLRMKNTNTLDIFTFVLATSSVLILCYMSGSRGPLGSLLFFIFIIFAYQLLMQSNKNKVYLSALIVLAMFGVYVLLSQFGDVEATISSLIERSDSHRLRLWEAVLGSTSENLWFGAGMATEFIDTAAGKSLENMFGRDMSHAHNLLLHLLVMAGLVGVILFLLFLLLLIGKLFSRAMPWPDKVYVFSILTVMILLNSTEGYRLVSSPRTDWVLVWLPLFFILSFAVTRLKDKQNSEAA